MATSIVKNEHILREFGVPNTTNINGFSITVASTEVYKFANGLIISRQGVNAFMINTNGSGKPSVTVGHIMGGDTFTTTVSDQTVNFVATTEWNDFKLLYSTTILANGISISPITTT